SRGGWHCFNQADIWSHIAHAAIKQNNGLLWDVAQRISHLLRVCDWRLRQVSECYRDLLYAIVQAHEYTEGRRFMDRHTWLIYMEIESFLVSACVLRDSLAEYRALLLSQSGAVA